MEVLLRAILLACAFAGLSVSARAETVADPLICELHVFGAQRDFTNHRRLAGPFAPRGSWQADRSNPLAAINLVNPVQRANDLTDDRLRALLPDADEVRIVRHQDFAEIGSAKRSGSPLAEQAIPCHAELFAMEFYDLTEPTQATGLLESLIMAPAGWHATYVFRRFDGSGKVALREKESMIAPLEISRNDWGQHSASEILNAITEATAASFEIMLERFERHQR